MKNIIFLLLHFVCFSQQTSNLNSFKISGTIENYNNRWLYLYYENQADSVFVKDNRFHFEGEISSIGTQADFAAKSIPSIMSTAFFLEPTTLELKIAAVFKKHKKTQIIDFQILDIKGSTKADEVKEIDELLDKYNQKQTTPETLLLKFASSLKRNPTNEYLISLLVDFSKDTLFSKEKLKEIYRELDHSKLDPSRKKIIEFRLFPEKRLKIGDDIPKFELQDLNNNIVTNQTYIGKYYLIDFWASWCEPCRKQFENLKKLQAAYKSRGFEIIALSIDKDEKSWIKAIEKEKLEARHVRLDNEFVNDIVVKFNVFSIPSNFLIDPSGVVVAVDLSPLEIAAFLDKKFK